MSVPLIAISSLHHLETRYSDPASLEYLAKNVVGVWNLIVQLQKQSVLRHQIASSRIQHR